MVARPAACNAGMLLTCLVFNRDTSLRTGFSVAGLRISNTLSPSYLLSMLSVTISGAHAILSSEVAVNYIDNSVSIVATVHLHTLTHTHTRTHARTHAHTHTHNHTRIIYTFFMHTHKTHAHEDA